MSLSVNDVHFTVSHLLYSLHSKYKTVFTVSLSHTHIHTHTYTVVVIEQRNVSKTSLKTVLSPLPSAGSMQSGCELDSVLALCACMCVCMCVCVCVDFFYDGLIDNVYSIGGCEYLRIFFIYFNYIIYFWVGVCVCV